MDLEHLITTLTQPVKGWPTPLSIPVAAAAGAEVQKVSAQVTFFQSHFAKSGHTPKAALLFGPRVPSAALFD
jgi:hypothetical protein